MVKLQEVHFFLDTSSFLEKETRQDTFFLLKATARPGNKFTPQRRKKAARAESSSLRLSLLRIRIIGVNFIKKAVEKAGVLCGSENLSPLL